MSLATSRIGYKIHLTLQTMFSVWFIQKENRNKTTLMFYIFSYCGQANFVWGTSLTSETVNAQSFNLSILFPFLLHNFCQ